MHKSWALLSERAGYFTTTTTTILLKGERTVITTPMCFDDLDSRRHLLNDRSLRSQVISMVLTVLEQSEQHRKQQMSMSHSSHPTSNA
eukprot:scaffold12950_cov169-Skeletonema_marinoi.AAC.1